MELSEVEVEQARGFFLSHDALAAARFMAALQRGEMDPPVATDIRQGLERLGWVGAGGAGLTETGWFAADSCREYVFWRERNRKLPFADHVPHVISECLVGKEVLELGSGSGINLMSIGSQARNVVGLEPMGIYRQIGAILALVEGYDNITSLAGRAEALPFETGQFDTVLCVSAHQYFDINPAFREIARVLKPGGEVVLVSGVLSGFAAGSVGQLWAGLGPARNYLVTIVNTLGYMFLGRRIVVRPSKWSTAFPVYPSRWAMLRMLRKAGLEPVAPPAPIGREAMFRARKPAAAQG